MRYHHRRRSAITPPSRWRASLAARTSHHPAISRRLARFRPVSGSDSGRVPRVCPQPRRMVSRIVEHLTGHDGDVGFGLRLIVESNGALHPYHPTGTERGLQDSGDESNCGVVRASLWLTDDQFAAQKLEWFLGAKDAD